MKLLAQITTVVFMLTLNFSVKAQQVDSTDKKTSFFSNASYSFGFDLGGHMFAGFNKALNFRIHKKFGRLKFSLEQNGPIPGFLLAKYRLSRYPFLVTQPDSNNQFVGRKELNLPMKLSSITFGYEKVFEKKKINWLVGSDLSLTRAVIENTEEIGNYQITVSDSGFSQNQPWGNYLYETNELHQLDTLNYRSYQRNLNFIGISINGGIGVKLSNKLYLTITGEFHWFFNLSDKKEDNYTTNLQKENFSNFDYQAQLDLPLKLSSNFGLYYKF